MKKFSKQLSDETKRNETKLHARFDSFFPLALKTIETQTPVHLVDLLIDLRDLFPITNGRGGEFYNLRCLYRVNHSPFFPSISFNDELQRIPKGSLIFFPSLPINFTEKHCIQFVYSKLKGKRKKKENHKNNITLTNYSIEIWKMYKNSIFLQTSRTFIIGNNIFPLLKWIISFVRFRRISTSIPYLSRVYIIRARFKRARVDPLLHCSKMQENIIRREMSDKMYIVGRW